MGRGCSILTGFDAVGRSWRSEATDSYEARHGGTLAQASELLVFEEFEDHVGVEVKLRTSQSGTLPQGPFTRTTRSTLRYRCDGAGLALLEDHSSTELTLPDGTSTKHEHKSYSPALLVMPAELQRGPTWAGRSNVANIINIDGEFTTESFEVVTEISTNGQVSVTTPAGTFDAWAVTTTENGETSTTFWAEGVGRVADDAMELVAYE